MNLHLSEDIFLQIIFRIQLSQSLHSSRDQSILDAHDIELLIKFQVLFQLY